MKFLSLTFSTCFSRRTNGTWPCFRNISSRQKSGDQPHRKIAESTAREPEGRQGDKIKIDPDDGFLSTHSMVDPVDLAGCEGTAEYGIMRPGRGSTETARFVISKVEVHHVIEFRIHGKRLLEVRGNRQADHGRRPWTEQDLPQVRRHRQGEMSAADHDCDLRGAFAREAVEYPAFPS